MDNNMPKDIYDALIKLCKFCNDHECVSCPLYINTKDYMQGCFMVRIFPDRYNKHLGIIEEVKDETINS